MIPARLEGGPHDGHEGWMPLHFTPARIAVRKCPAGCDCGRALHFRPLPAPEPLVDAEFIEYRLVGPRGPGLLYRYADMLDPQLAVESQELLAA